MALGSTTHFQTAFNGTICAPASFSSQWMTAIGAGRVATADAAAITNPSTEIVNSLTRILRREQQMGTIVCVRLAYGGTPSTNPVIAVFGRTGRKDGQGTITYDAWQRLYNRAATPASTATLTTAASTDVTDGTLKYSEVTTDHQFDCMGCDEILIGVQTAYAVSAGATTATIVQAKII